MDRIIERMSASRQTSLQGPPSPMATVPSSAAISRAVGVSKVYGQGATAVHALDDLTVGFPASRFTAIMGPSGSGKSTLLHCLAGLDSVTDGEVFLGSAELGALSDRELTELRRDRVGFVFQAFNLIPTLTAAENIVLPLRLAGRQADREWLDTVVAITGLGDRLTHRPAELSGGQAQRVAVARALASRPDVIFADEPTGNLDSRASAEILGFLQRAVRELGQTIVMVTHDPIAASYSDEVVFLADGRLVGQLAQPTPERVLDTIKRFGD
jgi:putative ABC transport system ATP-binding protein